LKHPIKAFYHGNPVKENRGGMHKERDTVYTLSMLQTCTKKTSRPGTPEPGVAAVPSVFIFEVQYF